MIEDEEVHQGAQEEFGGKKNPADRSPNMERYPGKVRRVGDESEPEQFFVSRIHE